MDNLDKEFEHILKTEYSYRFDELRKRAMVTSFYKYGPLQQNYSQNYIECIKSLEKRLQAYKDTGNTEYLIDIANFAMIEFMVPQKENARYKPTDSNECPGIVGMSINEMKAFAENN